MEQAEETEPNPGSKRIPWQQPAYARLEYCTISIDSSSRVTCDCVTNFWFRQLPNTGRFGAAGTENLTINYLCKPDVDNLQALWPVTCTKIRRRQGVLRCVTDESIKMVQYIITIQYVHRVSN